MFVKQLHHNESDVKYQTILLVAILSPTYKKKKNDIRKSKSCPFTSDTNAVIEFVLFVSEVCVSGWLQEEGSLMLFLQRKQINSWHTSK